MPDRQSWLEGLIAACEHAAQDLRARDDPALRPILDDVEALRSRLAAELRTVQETHN